jgi:hypothetical protein
VTSDKYCKSCGVVKASTEFYTHTTSRDRLRHECKECTKRNSREWQQRNPKRCWAKDTIKNHRTNGVKVSTTISELTELALDTTYCPICGVELCFGKKEEGKILTCSPSLDRIDRSKPMTRDNIQILCYACNSGKSVGSLAEYIARCKRIAKKYDIGDDIK